MRAVRLALFGLALPLLLFFAADLVLGSGAVRLMIPFYLFYFAVLFALFYKKYAELVNGLSELERLSALLPLGERIPDSGLDESDPLYPLAKNINAIDVYKRQPFRSFGGDEQIRTVDPLRAKQVLSQLSYTPVFRCFRGFFRPSLFSYEFLSSRKYLVN